MIGFRLDGELPEGATATDLVLTVTELLRKKGVVGKFVEFYGPGVSRLPLADRATIGNMSPEFGSTCAIFPIDAETLRYMRVHRPPAGADRAGRGLRQGAGPLARGRRRGADVQRHASRSTSATVVPSIAGPRRPQDRVSLSDAQPAFREELKGYVPELERARRGESRRASRRATRRPRPSRAAPSPQHEPNHGFTPVARRRADAACR